MCKYTSFQLDSLSTVRELRGYALELQINFSLVHHVRLVRPVRPARPVRLVRLDRLDRLDRLV